MKKIYCCDACGSDDVHQEATASISLNDTPQTVAVSDLTWEDAYWCKSCGDECGVVEHPNLAWAKNTLRRAKGDRITEEELNTVSWDSLSRCYHVTWRKMFLGVETNGDIHS